MALYLVVSFVVQMSQVGSTTAAVSVDTTLTGDDAAQHLGETNTVCGVVASARYVEKSREQPTYLNFDHPYPNQSCAVLIPPTVRPRFKTPPEAFFLGKRICVTGVIAAVRGKPQITISDPSQITIKDSAAPATDATATGVAE